MGQYLHWPSYFFIRDGLRTIKFRQVCYHDYSWPHISSVSIKVYVTCHLYDISQWWPLYLSHVSWGLNDGLYLSHVSWGLYDDLSISPMSAEVSMMTSICPMSAEVSMMTSLSVPCQLRSQWWPLYLSHVSRGPIITVPVSSCLTSLHGRSRIALWSALMARHPFTMVI